MRLVTNDFMYTGGDGYTVFAGGTDVLQPGDDLMQIATDYVTANSPGRPGGRGEAHAELTASSPVSGGRRADCQFTPESAGLIARCRPVEESDLPEDAQRVEGGGGQRGGQDGSHQSEQQRPCGGGDEDHQRVEPQ